MKSSTKKTQSKSPYRSQLRERQKMQTRELIVRAAGECISTDGKYDFTVQEVADRAGLSLQCVYDHFPSREDLVQGMCEWLYGKNRDLVSSAMMSLAQDVSGAVRKIFTVCDEDAAVTSAATAVSLNMNVRPHARRAVDDTCRQALAGYTSNLSSDEARNAYAVIRYLIGAEAWLILKKQFGLSTEEASNTVSWAIQTLVDDLKKRNAQQVSDTKHVKDREK